MDFISFLPTQVGNPGALHNDSIHAYIIIIVVTKAKILKRYC